MKNSTITNDLIEINNDRVRGYEKAMGQVKDDDLQLLFGEMIAQSNQYVSELRPLVQLDGKEPEEGTTLKGKIYRTWMDLKVTFSGNDRKTVLNSCEFGEDAAQRAYKSALEEDLDPSLRRVIENQQASLKESHDRIKALRDKQIA